MNTHDNQFLKIIGLGSPFGDDQIGRIITEQLKNDLPNFKILYFDRPGARLLEYFNNTQFIILIDAVVSNREVGTIHYLRNNEIDEFQTTLSSHGFGL